LGARDIPSGAGKEGEKGGWNDDRVGDRTNERQRGENNVIDHSILSDSTPVKPWQHMAASRSQSNAICVPGPRVPSMKRRHCGMRLEIVGLIKAHSIGS
jgi:hypothetical protein